MKQREAAAELPDCGERQHCQMDPAPCLCLPLVLMPNLSTVFLEEIDNAEGPNCSAGREKKTWIDEEEPGEERVEERGCSSEEGDCGCTIGNRIPKEAEPLVSYFSILSDTLTFRAEIVWESGSCNCLPCGQSLFFYATNNFSQAKQWSFL